MTVTYPYEAQHLEDKGGGIEKEMQKPILATQQTKLTTLDWQQNALQLQATFLLPF